MHNGGILALALVSALALGGCGIIYKPNIQQGNVLNADNVAQLQPGMTQEQVLALLGSPSISSPFDQSRWDYVHTLQHRGGKIVKKDFVVYFENGVLARTEGEFQPDTGREMQKQVAQYPIILHDREAEAKARRKGGG